MKTEQDTLERRLWAKQEKIKAEHEHQVKTDTELYVWKPVACFSARPR